MAEKEIAFRDFKTVQDAIVQWFNDVLPNIKDFPVSYMRVQKIPSGSDDSLTIAFPPTATSYLSDFAGDYIKTSFMLSYKTITRDSDEQLYAMKVLQYLLDEINKLNIVLGNDKIVIGFDGTMTPSIQDYNASEETSVYNAMYELEYKQIRRR